MSDAIWNSDGGEAFTAIECILANFSDVIWDSDGGEAFTAKEYALTNFSDTIWNNDGGRLVQKLNALVAISVTP